MALNFKRGLETNLNLEDPSLLDGDVYFTTNGSYGKIWYCDSQGKFVNVIPDVVDSGDWSSSANATNPTLQIKRGSAIGPTLSEGELGYNSANHGLYIGSNSSNVLINITTAEQTISGKKTFSDGLAITKGGITINGGGLTSAGNIIPSANSTYNLGADGTRWKNMYIDNINVTTKVVSPLFEGDLDGNAATATVLTTNGGSSSIPVYFNNGVPVAVTAENMFSAFSISTRSGTANTLQITVAGQSREVSITGADTSYAGLMTTGPQTFAGAKIFNAEVTIKGKTNFQSIIVVDRDSYGTSLPPSGVEGQIFFLLVD